MYFYQIVVLIINYHFYYLVSRSDTLKKFWEKIIDNIEDNAKIEKRLKEIEHAEEEIKKEKLQLSFKIKRLETEKQLLQR